MRWTGTFEKELLVFLSLATSGANTADVENDVSRADNEMSDLALCIEICGHRAKRLRTELVVNHQRNCLYTGSISCSVRLGVFVKGKAPAKEGWIIVYILFGISPASNCSWPTFRNPVSVPSSKAGCRQWLSTSSLWRWNWHRVPKRRPTTIWRRGNTQKNIYENALDSHETWCFTRRPSQYKTIPKSEII